MRSGIFPFKYRRLDKDSAAVPLIDHQSGLCNLVQDFTPAMFKNNVLALAELAKLLQAANHFHHQLRGRAERAYPASVEGNLSGRDVHCSSWNHQRVG